MWWNDFKIKSSRMKRQHRGCTASLKQHITQINIWTWKQNYYNCIASAHTLGTTQTTGYSPALYSEYARPVIRAGESDIKIRQLSCTSSRCVAIWQRVLICCVVCRALGEMCPLCAQLRAYSTWAEGEPGDPICRNKASANIYTSPSIFLSAWNSIWVKKTM